MSPDLLARLLAWLKQQPEVENAERAGSSVVALLAGAELIAYIEATEQ